MEISCSQKTDGLVQISEMKPQNLESQTPGRLVENRKRPPLVWQGSVQADAILKIHFPDGAIV